MMGIPSTRAWATSKRSNGSLWLGGKARAASRAVCLGSMGRIANPVLLQADIHEALIWLMQRQLADADLDGNLPIRSGADEDFMPRVEDRRLGCRTQLRIIERVPEQRVGVEKVPQG